jgi:hypothetical protein
MPQFFSFWPQSSHFLLVKFVAPVWLSAHLAHHFRLRSVGKPKLALLWLQSSHLTGGMRVALLAAAMVRGRPQFVSQLCFGFELRGDDLSAMDWIRQRFGLLLAMAAESGTARDGTDAAEARSHEGSDLGVRPRR